MIRLGMSVEGGTEREIVQQVIGPHLASFGIEVTPIDMGGKVGIDRIVRELTPMVYSFDRVTTLYDLYKFKKRNGRSADQLQTDILNRFSTEQHRLIIPYVQQFEIETLLFATPDETEKQLGVTGIANKMRRVAQSCGGVENINDGFDTCPSRRIKKEAGHFDKKLHGPMILLSADLAEVRQQAPRFGTWLSQLESLGS